MIMRWRGAAGVAVLAFVLAGCGGSDKDVAESGTPTGGDSSVSAGGDIAPTPGASTNPTRVAPSSSDDPGVVDLDAGVSNPNSEAPAGKAKPGTAATAEVVEPRDGMDNTHTVTWDKAVKRSDSVVRVYFYGGVEPCSVLDSVKVDETGKTITITLRAGADPKHPDAMCIQIAKYKAVDVKLSEPIGDREIVDGSAEE